MDKRLEEIQGLMSEGKLHKALDAIYAYKKEGVQKALLMLEADCYEQLQERGKAINVYKEILTLDPDDAIVAARKEQCEIILKFSNLDIYANPNLSHDPWE